ncbi:hypothetical protein Agabi119p4_665 [Agaricus bisporus var. burnettii]|uniref:AP complex subunit sigma n=1 Tax=Agaricus bisporus var. burnettii TaxID=192524 RepID=A0A8H7FAX2_AGABI|nr:hypothetical protein Agabi119p4_665 [Agaricus bisporus var. burnettii]
MINYVLLVSRQGKLRLAKWYATLSAKTKNAIFRDVTQLVMSRKSKMCNVLEYKAIGTPKNQKSGTRVIYKRYASLFFIAEIEPSDNELITLEIIHRYVEALDGHFGNVCELDLIFNFDYAYHVLDELILGGEMQETSKLAVLKHVATSKAKEDDDLLKATIRDAGLL